MITRSEVNSDNEYTILSYMIMNKDVLSFAYNRYKSGDLKTKHFTEHFRPIFRWLVRYHSEYQKAPKTTIQKIFEQKQKSLGSKSDLVEESLARLAEEYLELQEEDHFDPEYINKEILLNFIRQQEINSTIEKIQDKIDSNNLEEAEELLTRHPKISYEDEDANLGVIIPLTVEDAREHFRESAEEKDIVYQFDGAFGKLVGPLERSWLVAITGVEKSGKSYTLQEIAYDAAVYQKKKVLIINLELNKKMARNRLQRRISCTQNLYRDRKSSKIIYPIFDCENNQFGTCKILKELPNGESLFKKPGEVLSYGNYRKWITCTKCRDEKYRANASRNKIYIPALWFEKERVKKLTESRVTKAMKRKKMMRLGNLRVKCFPRFSVTFDETYDLIRRYFDKTKFEPDIIIWDYLDILAAELPGLQERIDVDRKWKKASKVCGELNCLGFTADQANKISREQRSLTQMSTSESKTKDSHLDVRIAINQTLPEMDLNVMRLNVLFHRHAEFNPSREVMVTQRLSTAESYLDNNYWASKKNNYPVKMEKSF